MCDIILTSIQGSTESIESEFEDCNGLSGEMTITLISELPQNQAGLYQVSGFATDGTEISEEVIVPNSERINPTKVFKWVVKKLKEIVCPTCM